jgi:uncharacterized membrane protein YfcA
MDLRLRERAALITGAPKGIGLATAADLAEKRTDIRSIVAIWALPAVLGVAVGSLLAAVAPAEIFKVAFVVVALALATKMLFGRAIYGE